MLDGVHPAHGDRAVFLEPGIDRVTRHHQRDTRGCDKDHDIARHHLAHEGPNDERVESKAEYEALLIDAEKKLGLVE